ncbi:MAG: CehA/McbA family metallohydrolase [Kofleriaceae bacterium]
MFRAFPGFLVFAGCVTACGDNAQPTGPQPLVPDPDVETGCTQPITSARARAKVVECAGELAPGRLAAGRNGDFLLENDRIRVILRGPGAGYYLHGGSGGGIIDAVRRTETGWSEDLVKEILPAVDLTVGAFDELVITEAGNDGVAEVTVRGPAAQLELIAAAGTREIPDVIMERRYRLSPGATEVEMLTRVFPNEGVEETSHDLYDAMFLGGRAPSFVPGKGAVEGQTQGDFVATSGTTTSYGLVYDQDLTLIDLAGIRLVEGASVDSTGTTHYFLVGDGSIASITAQGWARREMATLSYDFKATPGVDVLVTDAGKPITIARPIGNDVTVVLPAQGTFSLQALATGAAPGPVIPLANGATVERGPSGTLAITVRDDVSNAPLPARVVIDDGNDDRIVWTDATGDLAVPVVPGTVRVTISRGLEYDAFVATSVVVADGATVPVAARLEKVVDTAGWISIDTHLHTELSTDSTMPLDDRIRAAAAEGVEVPVSTDHDMITDYAPVIRELGLDDHLGSMIGSEVSSLIWGHLNGFPFIPKPDRTGNGSPSWLGRTPAQVFQAIRDTGNDPILQINHPRDGASSLFNALDLDPTTGIAHATPASLGLPSDTDLSDLSAVDAIEVANSSSSGDFEMVFDDWMKLVKSGSRTCATGSSDSHGASRYAGEARTYVWVGLGNDNAATVDPDAIVAAIRARNVVVSTSSFVTANIGSARPGGTAQVSGTFQLHIKVQAAPWRALSRIRIFEGGQEIMSIPLDPQETTAVRHDAAITLTAPPADTFYVIRVDNAGSGAPVNDNSMPSFTNPIFVDVP